MFADASVKYRHQIQPVAKGITNDALMGAFRALLEQVLRKYEGKPGDSQTSMPGGILEFAKSLPNRAEFVNSYVDRLFEWVVSKIFEVRKATQSYFANPRDGYSPLPTLEDLVRKKQEAKVKKNPQPFEKGKRPRNQHASCRICNITHEGKCKWYNHPDAPRGGATLLDTDKYKAYQKLRPDKRCPFQPGKKLTLDMRALCPYKPSSKERTDHVNAKGHKGNKKPRTKVEICVHTPTTNGLTNMQILTHTSDNQGHIKAVPTSILINSGACDGSYISAEIALKLRQDCVEIYLQHEWVGVFEEDTVGVLSSGFVEVNAAPTQLEEEKVPIHSIHQSEEIDATILTLCQEAHGGERGHGGFDRTLPKMEALLAQRQSEGLLQDFHISFIHKSQVRRLIRLCSQCHFSAVRTAHVAALIVSLQKSSERTHVILK